MTISNRPLISLQAGRWFKLICGASYHHLPAIRNLALAYGLAGADCIDVAADPAVVEAVIEAFQVISQLQHEDRLPLHAAISPATAPPFLMVSFSDGEDPHFRKATFEATACPADCSRPCEAVCPAAAIAFNRTDSGGTDSGVIEARCYGCGRCLPVCPLQHITTVTRATSFDTIVPQLLHRVDAVELHTQVGRHTAFMQLWSTIRPYLSHLKLISISCPQHDDVIDYLWQLYDSIQPLSLPLIWQTDGRSMSGDIGRGTTHETIRFGQKVLQLGPPGFVQLAGGTNPHTLAKLKQLATQSESHTPPPQPVSLVPADRSYSTFGGIAYGSFARRLMMPLLDASLDAPLSDPSPEDSPWEQGSAANQPVPNHLEASWPHLAQAVQTARSLVEPLKAASGHPLMLPSDRISRLLPSVETPV